MSTPQPELFTATNETTSQVMRRVAAAVEANAMVPQVRSAAMLAHWFLLDTMFLANQANREGMHANALAITRQCIESIGVIELGICGHPDAEAILLKWNDDKLNPGKLREWLQNSVWPSYGSGLWTEPWYTFMREFSAALQPYAHYSRSLAQWQYRLIYMGETPGDPEGSITGAIEMRPRAYDDQKATRITLFHAVVTYALGRVWMAANRGDATFDALVNRLGVALGKSRYLDGHQTDWGQQFWANVWNPSTGSTILE